MDKWWLHASCRGLGHDEFFKEQGHLYEKALFSLCASCPVWKQCLTHAIEFREMGFWAGTTERERDGIRRQINKQRRSA